MPLGHVAVALALEHGFPCEPQFVVLSASHVLLYTWYPLSHVKTVHVPELHENVFPCAITDELQAVPCDPQFVVEFDSH